MIAFDNSYIYNKNFKAYKRDSKVNFILKI